MYTSQDIIDRVMFHRTAIIKNMVAAILMVAIFAFEGCFNFATLTWDVTNLYSPAFWVKVGTKVILFIAIKTIALLTFMDVARKTNKNLVTQKKTNEDLMKLKESDFPIYIENILNPSIKIEAWKKKTKEALYKLEKHAKLQDRALYFSEGQEAVKRANKYCIKRAELELELKDDWIEKNLNSLNISGYAHIDPAVFDQPVINARENKYQLTARTKTAITVALGTGIVGLLISQMFWSAAGITPLKDYNALQIWISMLMDLIFLLWQGFTGVQKAFTTVNNEEVVPYVNRNRILKDYSIWKLGDKKDLVSKVEKWLNVLEGQNADKAENPDKEKTDNVEEKKEA